MKQICQICNKELNLTDLQLRSNYDFLCVCQEHRDLAHIPILEVAKIKNIRRNYLLQELKKCCICDEILTTEDIDLISETTVNATCKKHRLVSDWWQLDIAKDFFEYIEINNLAVHELELPITSKYKALWEDFMNFRKIKNENGKK